MYMEEVVYINGRFLTQNMTGVQRFALEICKELVKLRNDVVFLVPHSIDVNLIPKSFNLQVIGKKNGLHWEQIELPRYLKTQKNPLLINLCNRAPVFYKNNILVLHDVTFRRYPKSVSFSFGVFYKLMVPLLVKHAKQLLTVSEFSKNEIQHFYPNCKNNIEIIYNAVGEKFSSNGKLACEENYLLAVSSDYLHKNFHRLVEAFIQLNDPSMKLKIVGSKGKIAEQYQAVKNIDFIGRVSDEELIKLYQNAFAFVFPSLYEGFGIPPLEAQACGCPVLSSNLSVMPEVLADSVIYFNPFDIDNIVNAFKKVMMDKNLYNELINKGYKNVARFSWIDSAIKLNAIISSHIGLDEL
ncbi:glycosyltransferase family 4 protein [Orbus mooreae]|uniref:glycosyltransferase family 4 protein n=1 Tax=Orbus mooreae TaxID=3074107 RepID=UPI00370D0B57